MKKNRNNTENNKLIGAYKCHALIYGGEKLISKRKPVKVIKGNCPILVISSGNLKYRKMNKKNNSTLVSLIKMLGSDSGLHCLYSLYNASSKKQNADKTVSEYADTNGIRVIIDLEIAESEDDTLTCISSEKEDNKTSKNVVQAIEYSFDHLYRNRDDALNVKTEFRDEDVKDELENVVPAYVNLKISRKYLDTKNKKRFADFYGSLLKTLTMLSNVDWDASDIRVYRLRQSKSHKPQDRAEMSMPANTLNFKEGSLINICSYGNEPEKVRLHLFDDVKKKENKTNIDDNRIYLTNRSIENLFGREWIEGKEEKPGLYNAPVIVYSREKETYGIGLPKANRIDGIFFSSTLYEEKQAESRMYDYAIFNRYTDSRLYIDYKNTNYEDYGRVVDKEGNPAKKIMIPRYYKRLLGYLDYPMRIIRSEEYADIIGGIEDKETVKAFEECYEKINGEVYYRLRKEYISNENGEAEADDNPEKKKYKNLVIEQQKTLHLYDRIELLKIPKNNSKPEGLFKTIKKCADKFKMSLLKSTIGKSEYLLKTEWTSETDDRNNIARLSPNMMSLLGVSENDKVFIVFGRRREILRVLANDELTDYQIGIPANARKKLGMNSVNDIVVVHRDMVHIFLRHSEEQVIAILGTVLAVFQVINEAWIGVVICVVLTPLIMYFVLNEERIKVK